MVSKRTPQPSAGVWGAWGAVFSPHLTTYSRRLPWHPRWRDCRGFLTDPGGSEMLRRADWRIRPYWDCQDLQTHQASHSFFCVEHSQQTFSCFKHSLLSWDSCLVCRFSHSLKCYTTFLLTKKKQRNWDVLFDSLKQSFNWKINKPFNSYADTRLLWNNPLRFCVMAVDQEK